MAKGFGVREYTNLYERSEANAVRFKTASEFKRQQLEEEGFASSLTRHVLFAIAETVRGENARAGLDYLKTDGAVDYWGKRKAILALLATSSHSPTSVTCHIGLRMRMPPSGLQGLWRTTTKRVTAQVNGGCSKTGVRVGFFPRGEP